jgi:hypothetical protein
LLKKRRALFNERLKILQGFPELGMCDGLIETFNVDGTACDTIDEIHSAVVDFLLFL